MDYVTMAASVSPHSPAGPFHPVFVQRAAAVTGSATASSLGSTVHIGPVVPPERLVPSSLFEHECRAHGLPPLNTDASHRLLIDTPLAQLAHQLDAYTQFTGELTVPAAVVTSRYHEILESRNHRLLAVAAALTTYNAHSAASCLWEASGLTARTAVELIRARLNLVAARAFVLDEQTAAVDNIEHLDDMVRDAHDESSIGEGDFAVFRGLISHLKALIPGMCAHAHSQLQQLRVSCALATLKNLRVIRTPFAAYHSAQQHLTLGTSLLRIGHYDKGLEVLTRNLDYCRRHTKRALPDIRFALAEGYLHTSAIAEATPHLTAARNAFIKRGELRRAQEAESLPESLPHIQHSPVRHLAVAR